MFAGLKTDSSIQGEEDYLPGEGPVVLNSGLYDVVIKTAYITYSKGGALALNLTFLAPNGKEVSHQLWVTSGKEKGQKNYYLMGKNKIKKYLPGFVVANALCLLTVGKELDAVASASEERVVRLYNYEQKKEVPTPVPMLMDLIDTEVTLGIIKQIVDKTSLDDSGNYTPTGETKEINEIDRVFRKKDGLTVAEIKAGTEKSDFKAKWEAKNKDKVVNRAKGVKAGSANPVTTNSPFGTPTSSNSTNDSTEDSTPSLFGN